MLETDYRVVKVVSDGAAALRCVLDLSPDFAVVDISMPELDGIHVARIIQQAGLETFVVFMTIIDDEDYVQEARSVGHGYVLKHRLSVDLLAVRAAFDGNFFSSAQSVL
jgi:DNA-binding NarL/FixJ family response regulator